MNQVIWLVSILSVVSSSVVGKDVVHVHSGNGEDSPQCGSSSSPCQTLSKGVQQVAGFGKLFVTGNHLIKSTIKITKNMYVIGFNGTTFYRERGAKVEHLFDVSIVNFRYLFSKTGPRVIFTSLTAEGIGLVDVTASVTLIISRCVFRGPINQFKNCGNSQASSTNHLPLPMLRKTRVKCGIAPSIQKRSLKSISRFTLFIDRSMFVRTLPLKIENCPADYSHLINVRPKCIIRFSIMDSVFSNTKQWEILGLQKGKLENTFFDNDDGFTFIELVGRIEIQRCKFMRGNVNGGVQISHVMKVPLKGTIVVADSVVEYRMSKLITLKISSFESVIIKNCRIANNTTPLSPIQIESSTNIKITNLTCRNNIVGKNSGGCLFLHQVRSVMIHSSTFAKNTAYLKGGALYAPSKGDARVQFASGKYEIVNCLFFDNRANTGGSLHISGLETLIKNCSFIGSSALSVGGAVYLKAERDLDKSTMITNVKECLFSKNRAKHGGSLYVSTGDTVGRHTVENCSFIGSQAIKDGGAVVVRGEGSTTHSVAIIQSKFQRCSAGNQGGAVVLTLIDSVQLQECILVDNSAGVSSGAVHITTDGVSSQGVIDKTSFINCTAPSIYMHGDDGTIQNTYVQGFGRNDESQIHYEAKRTLMLCNMTVDILRKRASRVSSSAVYFSSSNISIHSGLCLTCPVGFNVEEDKLLQNAKHKQMFNSSLILECSPCSYNYYNVKKGSYHVEKLTLTRTAKRIRNIEPQKCLKCKAGGICDIEVKAVDNYWGYVDGDKVFFKVCPAGFCCSSDTRPCVSYNTCAPGRKGILCGTCDVGNKQSFVSRGCVQADKVPCNSDVFIVYLLLYTFIHTFIFVLITNAKDLIYAVSNAISSKLTKKKKRVLAKEENQELHADHTKTPGNGDNNVDDNDNSFSLAAFVQVTILYLQVASLMHVKFQDRENTRFTDFGVTEVISNILNFRFTIYRKVCPSDTLTLPGKEMILLSMKMVTFVDLLIFALIVIILKVLYGVQDGSKKETMKTAPRVGIEMESMDQQECHQDENKKSNGGMTLIHRLEITSIKFLKMYYTPVTKASLQMIHCVEILGSYHLFSFGDHVCFSPWQLCIIFVLLPGILLFPICFELAIRMLKKRQINSTLFTAATVCPYFAIFLYIWMKKYDRLDGEYLHTPGEETFAVTVLQTEQQLFRDDTGSLGWQIVQLYRTFLLNLLSIFLINPVYRSLATIPVLLLFITHDHTRQPYKNDYLNHLQLLSSRCLLLISVCNVVPSMSFMVDVTSTLHIYMVARIFSILELVLYAVVPLSLPAWKIWEVVKKRHNEKKQK